MPTFRKPFTITDTISLTISSTHETLTVIDPADWSATGSRAQLPVVDVAVLAETIATVAELRQQVDLLLKEVALSTEIKQNTKTHLHRYERALSKRGLIPMEGLGTYVRKIRQAHETAHGMTWENPEVFRRTFLMYQNPPDPLAAQKAAHEQTMSTLQGTLASLQVHNHSVDQHTKSWST